MNILEKLDTIVDEYNIIDYQLMNMNWLNVLMNIMERILDLRHIAI